MGAADLTYLLVGLSLLLATVLPVLLDRWAISAPMVLVAVGFAVGLTPLPDGVRLDPTANRAVIEHTTELAVIVALMGVGLALDRPLQLRRWASWRAWGPTWRMLGIAMPLCIAAMTLIGSWLGLGIASALLLAAALAPTDPVLASDVQVAGPRTGRHEVDEPDELRFTLTSEAGLNDGLAFPFVYAAVLLAGTGSAGFDWWTWISWYLVGKVLIGVVVGIVVGRLLAHSAFHARSRSLRVAERGEALTALAALLSAYGLAEVASGYGFLAVFACAMTFRSAERSHDYHAAMHEVTERLERLLTLILLLCLGVALSRGLLEHLDWRSVVVGLGLILVVRPVCGAVALLGSRCRMSRGQQAAVAFFGVRGIGSVYYLAYAIGEEPSLGSDWMWSTVAFTITASVVIHGVLATPVMQRVGTAE
ncbi:cation:proton antiporter domain-containing protein [Nocardioides sambongensis]|uniref:cation:proton antiporter domain-containing protein n=1 Tax=Nocardioides sambongensis TaxID=2589074 RepID=UPI001129E759|nr:cation:proton antiporter [Nocardioides sambongensis]